MKNQVWTRLFAALLLCCVVLLGACTAEKADENSNPTDLSQQQQQSASFTLKITHADGTEVTNDYTFEGEVTLGAYLQDKGIIAGDEGEFGLYIKTVDGETLDYETDGKYWALYVNGEYATVGADSLALEDGASYQLKAE